MYAIGSILELRESSAANTGQLPVKAMSGLTIMILPYGAGGEPGRGGTPYEAESWQPPDDFPSTAGAHPVWPEWYDGRRINETGFCRWFLERYPMQCVGGKPYTADGPVEDEGQIRSQILETIQPYVFSGISKKVTGLLDVLKLQVYAPSLPVRAGRIHLANGTLFLDGRFTEEKEFCSHRLAVAYHPDVPRPERWLHFLSGLLEPEDIPTLQEYLGYCLIPSTKGQKMMMLIGRGGEGKSRIGLVLKALFGRCMNTGSIQNNGILTPLLVRHLEGTADEYEVISGHRRLYAARKAGLETVPASVYAIDRDAASILLVDSNLHREHILPSEKTFAYNRKAIRPE